ncbi:MAG: GtrA family protein [Gammaproteobacteria bacterium]|nr:GtrA family protein [Gammaproteobacteria bacterium]
MILNSTLTRFGVTGVLATATHTLVMVAFVEWLEVSPVFAVIPAFLAALLVSYVFNYRWTFKASAPHRIMLPRFLLVALNGLMLNLLIIYWVVDVANYWYGYGLILVVIIVPLITFALSKFWVFLKDEAP